MVFGVLDYVGVGLVVVERVVGVVEVLECLVSMMGVVIM